MKCDVVYAVKQGNKKAHKSSIHLCYEKTDSVTDDYMR